MSYVIAAPEYVANAATDLANIGSAISDANSAAAGPVSSVLPAGADEVSASIASLFDAHAQAYQALSAAAQAFHTQFVQLMSAGAEQYALTEAANASPLQTVESMVSGGLNGNGAPGQALSTAQPLIGGAASAGSAAAGVPAAAAGVAGGAAPVSVSAPVAAVEAEAPALSPAAAIPAVPTLGGTPVAGAPTIAPPAAAGPAGTPREQPTVTPASAAWAE